MYNWPRKQNNPPLTISQLGDMLNESNPNTVGAPIWVVEKGENFSVTCVLDYINEEIIAVYGLGDCHYEGKDYGKTWMAYSKNPFENKPPLVPDLTLYLDFYNSLKQGIPPRAKKVLVQSKSGDSNVYHSGYIMKSEEDGTLFFFPDQFPDLNCDTGFLWSQIQ